AAIVPMAAGTSHFLTGAALFTVTARLGFVRFGSGLMPEGGTGSAGSILVDGGAAIDGRGVRSVSGCGWGRASDNRGASWSGAGAISISDGPPGGSKNSASGTIRVGGGAGGTSANDGTGAIRVTPGGGDGGGSKNSASGTIRVGGGAGGASTADG